MSEVDGPSQAEVAHPTFQEQFKKVVTLENGTKIVEIKPKVLYDETPIILPPGWSETAKTNMGGLQVANDAEKFFHDDGTTTERGRWMVAVDHPRTPDSRFDNQIDRKADNINSVLDYLEETYGVTEVDAILHSEAGANGLAAAANRPDAFRNLVLVNPAGSIGKDSFLNLYGKFNKMIGQDVLRSMRDGKFGGRFLTRTAVETIKYLAAGPKLAIQEASDMTKADIYAPLRDLHDMGKGIAIIHAADDPLFPSNKIRAQLSKAAYANGGAPIIDQVLETTGGHNALNSRPDIHMRQALRALELLKLHREVGKDRSTIIGDKLVLDDYDSNPDHYLPTPPSKPIPTDN